MSLYPQKWMEYLGVLQILFRLLGVFLLVPGFSHPALPMRFRILLAGVISLAMYPMLRPLLVLTPNSISGMAILVIQESAIGCLLGLACYLTFEAISLGAHFIGTQMGFGMAGVVDPLNHSSSSLMVPLQAWVALMVFLLADLHHEVLQVFVQSYEIVPSSFSGFGQASLLAEFGRISGKLFLLAVQMAAPFTLLMLAANIAVGVLSRMIPQMNIILFSFPITILLGLALFFIVAGDLIEFLQTILGAMSFDAVALLKKI